MSFKFGFGATAGHLVLTKGLQLGGIVLTAGFLRAAGVEFLQYQGEMPEDGRGIGRNTLVYSARNVQDLYNIAIDINDATKVSP